MLDAVAEAGSGLAEVDLGPVMPSGGPVASGKRASKLGTGGPGLGFGPGDGGVAREQRWSIIYNTEPDPRGIRPPARCPAGRAGRRRRARPAHLRLQLLQPEPTKRYGSGRSDGRLYFLWQGRGRKASDLALLRKAGIDVGEGVVLQFYPKGVEDQLAQLEVRYRGRQPGEIRVTRFSVVPKGNGYGFQVIAQETLR